MAASAGQCTESGQQSGERSHDPDASAMLDEQAVKGQLWLFAHSSRHNVAFLALVRGARQNR